MKEEWKKVKFGDFIELHRGYDLTRDSFVDGPFPVVCSTSIMGFHKEYKVQGPGVIIGRSGTLGQVQYVTTNYWPHNTALYVSDFKGNDTKFVKFFLQNFGTESVGGGAAVPTLNRNHLSILDVKIPPLPTQQKIASILSAYDDLIENNRKQIKLLEEAAQKLYKEWFVKLNFPSHETTKIVDGVPEGWKKQTVNDLQGKLESGSRPKGGIDSSIKNGIASVGAENVIGLGQYNYASEKIVSNEFFEKAKRGIIENKDILIYKDGAYIGRTSLFQDNFPHEKAMVNEHVFTLHAEKESYQYFLFFTLYQKTYFEKMQKLNKNAAQPGINQDAIKSLKLLVPTDNLVNKYDELVTPMVDKIFTLAKQIVDLQSARDKLLPRLMNGELEV